MIVVEDTTPRAYSQIIDELSGRPERPSRAGPMREELGVLIKSPDPRERYLFRGSYNLAFQLQEHWAYWEGANPGHVERYNSNMETWIDGETGEMPGSAYGDRMRNTAGHDQVARAVEQLRDSPETRRAMIMVHQPAVEDYSSNDVACTAYLHPFVRDGELHMLASLRSQDMHWGYCYDAANNQFIQEAMAGMLGVDVGDYWHFMDSCHYYTEREEEALEAAANGEPCSAAPADYNVEYQVASWERLTGGLKVARGGEEPEHELSELRDMGATFYADWLRAVASYELHRHHDDDETAGKLAAGVSVDRWRKWAGSKLDL